MSELRIFALGGLGEIGMNCLALEQRGEVLIVDCGVAFDNRGLGVDVIHPNFSALEQYRDRIVGVFLTHGHEDHIGALPYFLRQFDVPIWGPKYTLGLVKERAEEHEILKHMRLSVATPRTKYRAGSFTVEPIRVTHSIADATALSIDTDAGKVVHTGDFKFDEAPTDGEMFDVARFEELGKEGVSVLLSDSTNIDAPADSAGDEVGVGRVLEEMITSAKGAVVVAVFASNVHRLRMLGAIAKKTGRLIVPLGRSVHTHARVARATGYLDWPSDLVFPSERARELPRSRILGIATGTQAEPNAALARLARGDHPAIDVGPGDMVILSSRIIPGNEPQAFVLMGDLLRRGVELRSWYTDRGVHVSGHATRTEQTRMIEMVQPRGFIPLHGTVHHLQRHAALAREIGVANVCVLENGDVGTIDSRGVAKTDRVTAGRIHVFGGRGLPDSVLRERISLAQDGVVLVVVSLNAAGAIAGNLSIVSRGVLDEEQDGRLLASADGHARAAVAELRPRESTPEGIAETVRLAVRRSLMKALGFKPNVVVSVHRA